MSINITKVKICTYIPVGSTDKVREAIFNAGAGTIGTNYINCSSTLNCKGTFTPVNNANPYIGEKNKLEIVDEEKLEVICEANRVKEVIKALRDSHPYEEPAIDIIPLLDEDDFTNETRTTNGSN